MIRYTNVKYLNASYTDAVCLVFSAIKCPLYLYLFSWFSNFFKMHMTVAFLSSEFLTYELKNEYIWFIEWLYYYCRLLNMKIVSEHTLLQTKFSVTLLRWRYIIMEHQMFIWHQKTLSDPLLQEWNNQKVGSHYCKSWKSYIFM